MGDIGTEFFQETGVFLYVFNIVFVSFPQDVIQDLTTQEHRTSPGRFDVFRAKVRRRKDDDLSSEIL